MGFEDREFAALVEEIRKASSNIAAGDSRFDHRLNEFETSLNNVMKHLGRPGSSGDGFGPAKTDARAWCMVRKQLQSPKDDGLQPDWTPGSDEVANAELANKALGKLFRHADFSKLDHMEQKSLSSFSLGNNGWILSPERSSRVLNCLVEPTDVVGLVDQMTIGAGSVQFPIDNARIGIDDSAWACDQSCWANSQTSHIEGIGQLEIKAEPLRHVVCATPDLIQDAAINIENWVLQKVAQGFRRLIGASILVGNGVGKPQGLLGSVPICETSAATAAGTFTWQDLVSLAFEIPVEWHDDARFFMNQRTLALCLTMSDTSHRPLLMPTVNEGAAVRGERFSLLGFPVTIMSQLPDVAPGATPILFGSLRRAYLLVWRRDVTLLTDPYSAGFCQLYKFSARVGGAPICANAMRLLRIR
jgi:HK97 family phage major capsid protein